MAILEDALYERSLLFGSPMCLDFDESACSLHAKQRILEDLVGRRPFTKWIVIGHIFIIRESQETVATLSMRLCRPGGRS